MNLSNLPFLRFLYPIPVVVKRKDKPPSLDWGKKDVTTGDIILFSNQKRIPLKCMDGNMVYVYTENDQDFFPVEVKEGGKKLEPLPYDLRLRYILEREKIYTRTQQKGKYDQIVPVVSLLFVMITGVILYVSFDKQGAALNTIGAASSALAVAVQNMTQYCMGR